MGVYAVEFYVLYVTADFELPWGKAKRIVQRLQPVWMENKQSIGFVKDIAAK
jgi:hypothetical protein